MPHVLILGHDDVRAALSPARCAEAMAEVLAARARGEAFMPLRSMMRPPGASHLMGLMPAWRGGEDAAYGLKAICVMPENPARGLDSHQGTVTLFDPEIGVPTAILDASAITEIRTAAVTAVATNALARADARVLAIIGAGVQGRAHLRSLAEVRPWHEVRLYSRTAEHASAAAGASTQAAPAAQVMQSAQDALRGADVVVTATSSREPVLRREWLAEGAHVNAVGASMIAMRELDTATVAASAYFCDCRESVENEAGEVRLAIEEGAIGGYDHVQSELGELLIGRHPGRTEPAQLTVFRSLGIGVEDLAAAQVAVASARELGIGTELEL